MLNKKGERNIGPKALLAPQLWPLLPLSSFPSFFREERRMRREERKMWSKAEYSEHLQLATYVTSDVPSPHSSSPVIQLLLFLFFVRLSAPFPSTIHPFIVLLLLPLSSSRLLLLVLLTSVHNGPC